MQDYPQQQIYKQPLPTPLAQNHRNNNTPSKRSNFASLPLFNDETTSPPFAPSIITIVRPLVVFCDVQNRNDEEHAYEEN
jgi:hypothetical protein